MAVAVSMAKHLGAQGIGCALLPATLPARSQLMAHEPGCPVTVAMPVDTPKAFFDECELYGATIHRVQGTIADAGKFLREHGPNDASDISHLAASRNRIEGRRP